MWVIPSWRAASRWDSDLCLRSTASFLPSPANRPAKGRSPHPQEFYWQAVTFHLLRAAYPHFPTTLAGLGKLGSLSTFGTPLHRSFHRSDLGLDEGDFLRVEPVLGIQLLVDLRDWLRPVDV